MLTINHLNEIFNYFKLSNFRMACKRSSVRLRYSPQALNRLRAIFFCYVLWASILPISS